MQVTKDEYGRIYRQRMGDMLQVDPQVSIKLGNQEYTLEFNNFAAKGILRDTGLNILTDSIPREKASDPEFIGSLIYWGLTTAQPEMSKDEVDKLIAVRNLLYIRGRVNLALDLATPDMSDVEIEQPQEVEGPTQDPT